MGFNETSPNSIDFHSLYQLKYFLSQYVWVAILGVAIIAMIFQTPHHTTEEISSAQRKTPFNSSEDPSYFVHLTDVHVNSLKQEQTSHYQQALKVIEELNPQMVITTGDLVDNWGTNPVWKYSKQYPPDHVLYKNLTHPVAEKIPLFLDHVGNHDEFALSSFTSENHEFLNYSYYYSHIQKDPSYDDFVLTTYANGDDAYIIVNPINYPAPHALFDFFAHLPREGLDRIQNEIEKTRNMYKRRILFVHWPAYLWDDSKSSAGKTYRQIIEDSDLDMVISGHTHPETAVPQHHKQTLEVIGSDSITHKSMGIVTYDNGLTTYHRWCSYEPKKFVITYPCPKDQLSKKVIFNENEISVRALVFDNGEDNVEINVDGDLKGKMQFVRRLTENTSLYSISGTFSNGEHKLVFSGYDNESLEFYIGERMPPYYEKLNNFYNQFKTAYKAMFIFLPFVVIILFPVPIESYIKPLNDFMNNSLRWFYIPWSMNFFYSIFNILFGFFTIRWRILKLKLWIRIVLFVFCLLPFVCPYSAMAMDGLLGNTNFLGYYGGGNLYINIWGQIFTAVFIGTSTLPASIAASCISVSQSFHIIFIFDILVCIACLAIALYFMNTYLTEAVGTLYANLSSFLFSPVIQFIILIVYRAVVGAPYLRTDNYSSIPGSVASVL